MSEVLQLYKKTRSHSNALCEPLQIEDYIPQPVDFASPPKWHLSHSTWFFEQMILPLLKQRNVEARERATADLAVLAEAGDALNRALVRQALRSHLGE